MRTTRFLITLAAGGLLMGAAPLPAEDATLSRLESSPRHHEWVEVSAGDRKVRTFVVYPQTKAPTPAVVIIHENRGLTDWVRGFADQVAEAGYVAVSPDFLSGFSEKTPHTGAFENSDAAREAIYQLPAEQVIADLKGVHAYAAKNPASNGEVVVAGFCWGGAKSFEFAAREKDLAAVLSFYGSPVSDPDALKRIEAPIFGFYGEDDARINAQLPAAQAAMKKLKKPYEVVIYDGAGHAFMRLGEEPGASEANKAAREKAWERMKKILADL